MIHNHALVIRYGKQNLHVYIKICTFITVELNLLHVSATDCGHYQGSVL
jgi:hypothetical protein